jgi:hypothetical protein
MDAELIAQGKDVSDPNLRYLLASRIFSSAVPLRRKDKPIEGGHWSACPHAGIQHHRCSFLRRCGSACQYEVL